MYFYKLSKKVFILFQSMLEEKARGGVTKGYYAYLNLHLHGSRRGGCLLLIVNLVMEFSHCPTVLIPDYVIITVCQLHLVQFHHGKGRRLKSVIEFTPEY
jgi:hypothetical protein